MFERNRIHNVVETFPIAAEIALATGERLAGQFLAARGRDLNLLLNNAEAFVAFQPYGEDTVYLAKSSLTSVRPLDPPPEATLSSRNGSGDQFDPFEVLGVTRSNNWDDVRAAYRTLSMAYHPDRYASAELPEEVATYLATTSRRINVAYSALETMHIRAQCQAAGKVKPTEATGPIYERRPNGM